MLQRDLEFLIKFIQNGQGQFFVLISNEFLIKASI